MTTATNEADFLEMLFGNDTRTDKQRAAEMEAIRAAEAKRIAEHYAAMDAYAAEKIANRCPKCSGTGRLPQFQHRNGGECFLCGATGIFTRYAV